MRRKKEKKAYKNCYGVDMLLILPRAYQRKEGIQVDYLVNLT